MIIRAISGVLCGSLATPASHTRQVDSMDSRWPKAEAERAAGCALCGLPVGNHAKSISFAQSLCAVPLHATQIHQQ